MRQLSATALQAVMAQNTAEVFLSLLRIEHPDLAEPVLLVYDSQVLVRSDGTYMPYPFQILLPEQSDTQVPTVTLTVDNASLEVNNQIRSLVGPPKVTFMVVLASSPEVVEAGPFEMSLLSAVVNAGSISGTLGQEMDIFGQQVPGPMYLPSNSAGLFL